MAIRTEQVVLLAMFMSCIAMVHANKGLMTFLTHPQCPQPGQEREQGMCERRAVPLPEGQQAHCQDLTPDQCPPRTDWLHPGSMCFHRSLAFSCKHGIWTRTDEGPLRLHRQKRFWAAVVGLVATVIQVVCTLFCSGGSSSGSSGSRPPNKPPQIKCPGDITRTAPAGKSELAIPWTSPTASDPDGGTPSIRRRHGQDSGSIFTEGRWYITFEAKDQGGLTDTCSFLVHVKVVYCSYPRAPVNGQYPVCSGAPTWNQFGAQCLFSCDKGFKLKRNETLTCNSDQHWSHPWPQCSPVLCGAPGSVSGGSVQCSNGHGYPSVCSVQCRPGYTHTGNVYITCTASGQWTQLLPCQDTEAPTFPDGCPPDREEFSGPLGKAVNVTWMDPVTLDNSGGAVTLTSDKRSGSSFLPGDHIVKVTIKDSAGNSRNCRFFVKIKERQCDSLFLSNGHVTCDHGNLEGSNCTVGCNRGYEVNGHASVTCQNDAKWSAALPACQKVKCLAAVPEVKGGTVHCPPNAEYQTTCYFLCHDGYRTRPPVLLTCKADGTWSPPGSCQDTARPVLDCPGKLEVFAARLGQNTSATWNPPTVSDNSGENLTATSDVTPGSNFSVGVTYVTYKAADSSGNSGSCDFSVTVNTQSCKTPDLGDTALLYQCDQGHVYGAECTVKCSYGYPLQGSTNIVCERDDSHNPPELSWQFSGSKPQCIKSKCPNLQPPTNGAISCVTGNYGQDCQMSCNADYDISQQFDGHFVCTNSEQRWRPTNVAPSCIVAYRPGQAKLPSQLLYFTNSCEVSLQQIKENFIKALLNSTYKDACINVPSCTVANVQVTCGSSIRRQRSVGSEGSEVRHDRHRRQTSQAISIKFDLVVDYEQNGTEEETFSNYKSLETKLFTSLKDEATAGKFDLGPLSPDLRNILQPLVTFDGCPNGTLYSSRFTNTKASCVGCSRGNYLQGTQCVQCPRGQYTKLDIAISCDTCPPGFSTPTTGAESKDQCKEFCTPGYFSPTGFTPCQPCPAGGYQSRDQGVTCDLCPAGTWTVFAAAKSRNDCVAADVKLTANASLTLSLTSPQGPVTLITWLNLQTNCSLSLVLGLTIPNVAPPAPVTLAAITEGAEDSLDQALLADGRYFQISAKQWTRLTMVMSIEGGGQMLAVYNGSQRVYSTSLPPLNTTFTVTITTKPLRGTGLVSGMHGQVGEWSGQQIAMSSSTCMDNLDNTTLTWTPHPVSIITPSSCDAVDACASSPCGPHGQCEDTQAGHLCHCQQGWSGDACQVAPDACYQHQCQNSARCVVAGQNYSCECPEDWSGHLCQLGKMHGGWGEWGRWSNCSARCKGEHHRQRQCNNPVPASGGRLCSGVASESRSCGDSQCAEDGAWSLWVPWSTCSATCGGGSRRRSRRCDNPAPKNGGANCGGPNLYIESCATALCPRWGNWMEWSPCSVTCGDGTQSRDRSCDSPVPANEGQPCQGSSNQTRPCGLAKCPVCSELYELEGTIFNCSEKTDPYRKTCKVTCTGGYTTVHRPEYTCGQETGYLWPFERASVKVDAKHAIMYCQHELTPKTLSLTTNTVLKPDAKCEQRDKIEPQVANNLEKLPCRHQDKCKTKVTTTCGSPSSYSGNSRRRRETESVMVKVEFTADLGPSFVLNGSDPSGANKFIENFKVVDQSAAQIALNGSIFSVTVDNVTITPDVSKLSYTTNIACSPGATGTNGGGCVNCPPGYYEKEGLCEVCPLGQYQDQPGSTSCQLCPPHTTWDTTGASQRSQCLDTTKENATREPEKKDHTGIIIGAVVGSFVAVAILVIIVVCWRKYKGKPARPRMQ